MMNSIEFRVAVTKDVIEDVTIFLQAGFRKISEDEKSVILELPAGWNLEMDDDSEVKKILDSEGNVRGAAGYRYAYLRCRYSIASEKNSEEFFPETERLFIQDKKTGEEIMNFGKFEPYSDYEKDLRSMARMILFRRYPKWEDPNSYWED